MTWFSDLNIPYQPDAPLAPLTWYGLGGPARYLFEPQTAEQTAALVARCNAEGVPWKVLGRGANVLVRDAGFDGAVIRLIGREHQAIEYLPENQVRVAAGADFLKLVSACVNRGLAGLENLAGIPGSMGGIVRMNAGGRFGEIADYVTSVQVLSVNGRVESLPAESIGFSYRNTNLAGCVVLSATLQLGEGDPRVLQARYRELFKLKYDQQPAVAQRSAGCIFKNPGRDSAGRLIDTAGLKGVEVNGAIISPKHANFITVSSATRAQDVLDLIALAKDRVHAATGVELQLEIDIW